MCVFRYTDIFKENGEEAAADDPFNRASAPPISAVYETCNNVRAEAPTKHQPHEGKHF